MGAKLPAGRRWFDFDPVSRSSNQELTDLYLYLVEKH
jgi:hypothetical protein